MAISAAFTVNGNANPAAHAVAYGATVTLALLSTSGANSIVWEVMGRSHSDVPVPTISLGGTPNGATATFTWIPDPSDTKGRSILVRVTVTDSQGTQVRQGTVIGTAASNGFFPVPAGEEFERDNIFGWGEELNDALASAGSGSGDVVGPGSAVDSRIAVFDTTTGKKIKDGGTTISTLTTATSTAQTTADSALARNMFALTGASNDIASTHVGKVGTVSHTSTTTYTVRLNSNVAIAAKSEITLIAIGVGQLVIAAEGGVTIRTAETLKARKQYSWVTLKKDATTADLWWLTGDLELA